MTTPAVVEIDIPSRFELVTVVRMVVAAAAIAQGALTGERLDDLRWVTSEATTNAIKANLARFEDQPGRGRVRARCEVNAEHVRLVVTDQGPGMPEPPELPDITHPDRLNIEGGFGVPLMKQLSGGEVDFVSTAQGTRVELRLLR